MIETVRRISRNVKRWQSGDMCLRWTAAGMLEAERQFRKIIGHSDLAKLALAVERDVAAKRAAHTPTTPIATRRWRPPLHPPEIIH
jgi:putative transposase